MISYKVCVFLVMVFFFSETLKVEVNNVNNGFKYTVQGKASLSEDQNTLIFKDHVLARLMLGAH